MGLKPRMGRPPVETPRSHVVHARLTRAEYRAVRDAARRADMTTGAWIRAVAHEAIKRQEAKR